MKRENQEEILDRRESSRSVVVLCTVKVTGRTNNYAVSMNDMASATKEAAAVANNYGVSIEELTALVTMATARTRQNGSETGNAIKSLMLNLNDVTNQQIVKAFDYIGVSMYKMVDGSKRLKTPIELLGELSEVFNNLPDGDDKKAYILSEIGGKYRSNTLAAILQDWKDMEGIMATYESGEGSALAESEKTVKNLNSQLQILKNTGVDIVQDFFDSKAAAEFVKTINILAQGLDTIIEKIGAIPTLLGSITAVGLFKNGGRVKSFTLKTTVNKLTGLEYAAI